MVMLPQNCWPIDYWVQLLFNFTPVSVRQVRPGLKAPFLRRPHDIGLTPTLVALLRP